MQVLWWKLIIYDLPMGKVSVSLTVSFGFVTYFWMRWSVRCGHKARHRRSIRGKKAYLYSQVLETRGTACRAIWGSTKVGWRQWTRGKGRLSPVLYWSSPGLLLTLWRVCRQEGSGLDAGGTDRRAWWHVLQKPRWGPEHGDGMGDGASKQMWAGLEWGFAERVDDRNQASYMYLWNNWEQVSADYQ